MNGADAEGEEMTLFIPKSALTRRIGSDGLVLNLATDDWFRLQTNIMAIQALPRRFDTFQDSVR